MTPWQEGYVDGGAIAWSRHHKHKPDRRKLTFTKPEYQSDYDDGFQFGWNDEMSSLRGLEILREERQNVAN